MRSVPGSGQRAVLCVLAVCCVLSLGRSAAADGARIGSCPCGRGAAEVAPAILAAPVLAAAPAAIWLAPLPPVLPPPGTLGVTYARQSWPIPADRHPRVAMLDVRAPAGATDVRVFTTYEYREEDEIDGFRDPHDPCVWHFETKPLIPGIPHVYRVEAYDASGADVRFVRLIRGRRVTLEY